MAGTNSSDDLRVGGCECVLATEEIFCCGGSLCRCMWDIFCLYLWLYNIFAMTVSYNDGCLDFMVGDGGASWLKFVSLVMVGRMLARVIFVFVCGIWCLSFLPSTCEFILLISDLSLYMCERVFVWWIIGLVTEVFDDGAIPGGVTNSCSCWSFWINFFCNCVYVVLGRIVMDCDNHLFYGWIYCECVQVRCDRCWFLYF